MIAMAYGARVFRFSRLVIFPSLIPFIESPNRARKITSSTERPWSFDATVACISKNCRSPSSITMLVKDELLPSTPTTCGEDSFCIAENNIQFLIAIADGVGSWRKRGIDPARFSQSLMSHADKLVEQSDPKTTEFQSAITLMKAAFWNLVKSHLNHHEPSFGSSTACFVTMDRTSGLVSTANLGDSGLLLIRSDRIYYRSKAQQHRFNSPFQLTLRPDGDPIDTTATADVQNFEAEEGDLLILATDGLLDNLFDEEIMEIIKDNGYVSSEMLKRTASKIVHKARVASMDTLRDSPFMIEANKHGLGYTGGKPDDITVILARVDKFKD